jgi:hypothetical protein
MSTGKRAFTGDSKASLIAAIPERAGTDQQSAAPQPASLDRLVRKCLAKIRTPAGRARATSPMSCDDLE